MINCLTCGQPMSSFAGCTNFYCEASQQLNPTAFKYVPTRQQDTLVSEKVILRQILDILLRIETKLDKETK